MPAILKEFRVEQLQAAQIIGRKISCKFGHPDGNPIGDFWSRCFQDGTMQKLQSFEATREPVPAFGWIGNFDHAAKTFDYVVAALTTAADARPFEGAVSIQLPALRYAIGTIEGSIPEIFSAAPALVGGELEKRGLRRSATPDFEMEAYDQRFQHGAETTIIEFWVPLAS